MKSNTQRSTRAFTLIEMLVVIVIIGILAALLVPAVNRALDAAQVAKAKSDLSQLVTAVKSYEIEYGVLPTTSVSSSDGPEATEGWFQDNNDELMRVLSGEAYNNLNQRRIVFMEFRAAKGSSGSFKDGLGSDNKFYDPWGTPYAVKLDTSYNNMLEYYDSAQNSNLSRTVIAISFGKNKVQQDPTKGTDKGLKVDDLVSFK
ncbi:MAG: prepilin-type N-terminal cleavage/methylation domain-containing protein [Candidatus Methylacidiphilales bacterium]|nr:prepilin-type N-terminal cleavage/methylation domain-containing protein [Candidatus Methylacidiphilales bacterium]